jgi:hypothetical protein
MSGRGCCDIEGGGRSGKLAEARGATDFDNRGTDALIAPSRMIAEIGNALWVFFEAMLTNRTRVLLCG